MWISDDLTHENCPRNALGASGKNAREMVTLVRHGMWVVDDVSCRGHHGEFARTLNLTDMHIG